MKLLCGLHEVIHKVFRTQNIGCSHPILQIRKVRQAELKPQILNGKWKPELWLTQCFLL